MSSRGELTAPLAYADAYVGWPVAPKQQAHGVYGTFLNPTTKWPSGMPAQNVGYHKAIDIPVNDATGTHAVFAVEGGVVSEAKHAVQVTPLGQRVQCGVVGVGHFRYAHVVPEVSVGDGVAAGDRIGHTCPGWWHVHLEEWHTIGGTRVAVNPLRPGGKLAPVVDTGGPAIKAIRFYSKADENRADAPALDRERLRGIVVPVTLAVDPFPLRSWPQAPTVALHVYRAWVELARGDTVVVSRKLFQIDTAPGPTWRHYFRPLTRRSAPVAVCVVHKPADCAGKFWLRLWEQGWNTASVPNGRYRLTVTVEDTVGQSASRTTQLRVAN